MLCFEELFPNIYLNIYIYIYTYRHIYIFLHVFSRIFFHQSWQWCLCFSTPRHITGLCIPRYMANGVAESALDSASVAGLFDHPLFQENAGWSNMISHFTRVIALNLGMQSGNGRDGRFCQWHAGCDTLKDEQIEGSSSPSFPIPCNTVFPTVLHETAFPTKMYPDSLKYSCEIQTADPWETLLVQRGRTRTDSVCEFHGQEPWACCNFSSRWYQIACCDPDYQLVVNFYVPRPAERFQGLWIIILLVCHSFAQTPAYHSQ